MRLVVTGGRNYSDTHQVWRVLDDLHQRRQISALICGEAPGLDARARVWARRRGIDVDPYPADWALLGRAAGPIRNQHMIDLGKPDFGLVFPGGRGTADMRSRLVAAGIPFEEAA